jgi:formylglycine-generating enzyme required for sulfatase activity
MKGVLSFAASLLLVSVFCSHAQESRVFKVGGVSFTMIYVEGGTFEMGHTIEQGSAYNVNELPVHKVTLDSFWIGQTEVTQELWVAVMGSNPSRYDGDLNRPVDSVNWASCMEFISKLNALTGMEFRLPTESEWEFAARGGKKSRGYKYSGSNRISEVGWHDEPHYSPTHPVASLKPNELGIYDMTGNLEEWCSDYYKHWPTEFAARPQRNPKGPGEEYHGGQRVLQPHVIRGTSKEGDEKYSYIAARGGVDDVAFRSSRSDCTGFRIAL